ncbi:MAG: TetR/AcrR family transcriptional regulator [Caulobacteraceae bacterium]|nr:TetR/AcrR family transcriptional regulator [Caulobacteraceae bacterium]
MGVRQVRKQATRERVLVAARELFEEVGYEEATVREIARRAGVSVGSVFTTFSGKAAILSQVMADRLEALFDELDQVLSHLRGSTADRLRSIMAVQYSFETRRLRLFMAYIGASYSWAPGDDITPLGRNPGMRQMLAQTLRSGIERGEVRADADIDTFTDLLLAAYVWNYRLAYHEGALVEDLTRLMDHQIGVLFDGIATRG